MPKIEITSVQISNFMSIEHLNLDTIFHNGKVSILTGKNGVGKSSILESIIWCFYGVTRSGLEHVSRNNKRKKDKTFVKIIFNFDKVQYQMIRRYKSSPVITLINLTTGEDITSPNSKNFISDLMPFELFNLLCYSTKDFFLELTDLKKRELFSKISDINKFDEAYDKTKIRLREKQNELMQFENQKNILNSQIKQLFISVTDLEQREKNFNDYKEVAEKNLALLPDKNDILQLLEETNTLLNTSFQKMQMIKSLRTSKCPICGSEPKKEDIEEVQKNLPILQGELNSLQQSKNEILSILNNIESNSKFISQVSYKELIQNSKVKIDLLQDDLMRNNNKVNNLQEEINYLNFWQIDFSQKGIYAALLQDILRVIEGFINSFLNEIEFNIDISLTKDKKNKEEKIKTLINNKEYSSLSTGEKRKVDIAVLAALRQIYSAGINIVMLDEVLDTLDLEGAIFVIDFIKMIAKDTNCAVIITSHSEKLKELENTILVNKTGGITNVNFT